MGVAALPSCLTKALWKSAEGRLVEVRHTSSFAIELTGEGPDGDSLVIAAKPAEHGGHGGRRSQGGAVWRLWPVACDDLARLLLRRAVLTLETLAVDVVWTPHLDRAAHNAASLRLGGRVDFAAFGRPADAVERLGGLLAVTEPRLPVGPDWLDDVVLRIESVAWSRITGFSGTPRVVGWRSSPGARFTPSPDLGDAGNMREQIAALEGVSLLLAIDHAGDTHWFVLDAVAALICTQLHFDNAMPPHWYHESNWRPEDWTIRRIGAQRWPTPFSGTMQLHTIELVWRKRAGRVLGCVLLTPFTLLIDGAGLLAQFLGKCELEDDDDDGDSLFGSLIEAAGRSAGRSVERAVRHTMHR